VIIILVTSFSKNFRDHYIGNEISQFHDLQSLDVDVDRAKAVLALAEDQHLPIINRLQEEAVSVLLLGRVVACLLGIRSKRVTVLDSARRPILAEFWGPLGRTP
jgi:hypothetical protein